MARYTEEYKQEALELWCNSGRSAANVAAELGIRAPLLYRWARLKREYNLSKAELSRGAVLKNWKRRSAACAPRTPSSWNNVKFKKSLGILSEVPPRVMPGSNR
jgi:transposase-like protein